MIVISVLIRRLREGKTYEDFRAAWLPDQGFDFPTRVVSARNVQDEREVITIGFSELSEAEAAAQLQKIGPQENAGDTSESRSGGTRDDSPVLMQVADGDFTDASAGLAPGSSPTR